MLDVSVCAQCLEVSPQNKIIKENEMVYEGTSVQFAQQLPESESHSVMSESLQPYGLYTVHGILQARILEWVAAPFSRGSSQSRDQTQVSHIAGRFFTS